MLSTNVRPTPVKLKIVSVNTAPLMTKTEVQADDGDDRQHRILKGVLAHDNALAQPLSPAPSAHNPG